MQNGNIIQATGVCKTCDTVNVRVSALKGVDLSIMRGEIPALMCMQMAGVMPENRPPVGQ